MRERISRNLPWIGGAVFALLAWSVLAILNKDYLYTVQERSLFLANHTFWEEMTAAPGGVIRWAGCYLTQFFYYPALGAALLTLLWLVTYLLAIRVFRLQRGWSTLALIPPFALLCSVIGLGYWLYYIKIQGYWFSESLGVMLLLAALWVGRIARGKARYLTILCGTVIGYPLSGWYALLGALMMAILYGKETVGKERLTLFLYTLLIIGTVPLLWYYHYEQIRLDEVWTYGFPLFQRGKTTSWITALPFLVLATSLIVLAFVGGGKKGCTPTTTTRSIVTSIGILVTGCITALATHYHDENYHAEMRMYRHTANGDWEKVLEEARSNPDKPTHLMVMLRNIALMNLDSLGTQTYHYENNTQKPHTRDKLEVSISQTASPLIYYHHGLLNYATRWAIENGVKFGFKINDLKLLTRCAILNGEKAVADKYIHLLEQTLFHKGYARHLKAESTMPTTPEKYRRICELNEHQESRNDSDDGFCEMYIRHEFATIKHTESRLRQELALHYAMLNKDPDNFWVQLKNYAALHEGEEMPIHYQEAAFLFGEIEGRRGIDKLPFDRKKVRRRYLQFNSFVEYHRKEGKDMEEISRICKPLFGDTYWWHYHFCNEINDVELPAYLKRRI